MIERALPAQGRDSDPARVPDDEFNEIFARLPSHRDRALVAFYVSTGARASELLSVTLGGVDPGRQLIRVIRKGSGAAQELPASSDAFVWLRLYQVEMGDLIPPGRRQPLWWTLRRPPRPLTYHGAHRMFERVNVSAGTTATLHSLRHTAAYRMARGPGAAAHRRAGGARARSTHHHSDLPHPAQGRRDPPGAGPPRRADPPGGRAGAPGAGAGIPARDARGSLRPAPVVTTVTHDQARLVAGSAARVAAPARSVSRPARVDALAGHRARPRQELLARLMSPPFVLETSAQQADASRGLTLMLDWLADQPGRDLAAALAGQRRRRRGGGLAAGPGRVAAGAWS